MKTRSNNFRTKRVLAFFLALVLAMTSFPLLAFATDESGIKPEDGVSEGSPFVYNQPSQLYRIPNLVTLDDGTLIAQADARWDGAMDGGGNDSMVARSTDGGATWHYSMLTYYPDNGNKFDKASTSICDSALATDGVNVYSLSTFFPAGYALNESSANAQPVGDKAFDSNGRLLLRRNGSGYDYYLGEFDKDGSEGRALIYSNDGTPVKGYTVDHDFYLYIDGSKRGTLFYSDCEFQTVKTTFLIFRSSTDGGQTWSDMKLVDVKYNDEQFCGVGPGRGLVTSDGTIIFGCYSWNGTNGSQASSFIYSKDGGETWTRTESLPDLKYWIDYTLAWNGTSECQPVELDDGTIRLFCRTARRRIVYADAKKDSNGNYYWVNATEDGGGPIHIDSQFNGQDFDITENNQYSVIKYSKKVLWDGDYYTMLIASHANGGGATRANGTLTFLLLNTNNDVVNAVQYQYTTGGFGYSCLTELPNGQIAVLYEDADDFSTLRYFEFPDIEEISGFRVPDIKRVYNVSIVRHDSQTYAVTTNEFTNTDDSVVSTEFVPNYSSTAQMGSDATFSGQQIPLSNALYTFTQTADKQWYVSSMGVHLTIETAGQPSTKDRAPININYVSDGNYFQFIDDNNEALYMWRDNSTGKQYQFDQTTAYGPTAPDGEQDYAGTIFKVFRPTIAGETSSVDDPVPGYKEVTKIEDGGKYLIGCEIDGTYYFLYPSLSGNNVYTHTIKGNKDYVEDGYDMTITGLKSGTATITCGNDTYEVQVSDYSREIVGIVDYDPVIYTHGSGSESQSEIVTFGSNISDGSVEGEKVTEYRINDPSYKILSITPVEAFGDDQTPLDNSHITAEGDANGGKLTGNLSLANTSDFNAYNSGTYVTLKTLLQDSTGLIWVQTDRLYVASNPVPGHVIVGNFNKKEGINSGGINLSTFIMAYDSYGNTTMTPSQTNTTYIGNAKVLYPNLTNHSVYNDSIDDIAVYRTESDVVEYKASGIVDNFAKSNIWGSQSNELYILNNPNADTVNVAYYYYDKSSDKNEGIVADPKDPSNFSLVMKRMPVDVQYSADGGWKRTVIIGGTSSVDGTERSRINKISGSGTITPMTYMFGGTPDNKTSYSILSDQHAASATVQCSTKENGVETVQPNTTASLKGEVQYQEGAERTDGRANSWNDLNLTFEIKMCDKSNERKAYDDATTRVEKSIWYTTDSWYNYMNAILIRQEYLNNYTLLTTDAKRQYNSNPEYSKYSDYFTYDGQDTIELAYEHLQKRADFTPLEDALEDNLSDYQHGITLPDGTNYTPDSYIAFHEAYDAGMEFLNQDAYDTEDERNNTPGYVLTPTEDPDYVMGPDVDTEDDSKRLEVQVEIEDLADDINNAKLSVAADDEVYVAVKNESERIDKTAYEDNGAQIEDTIKNSDTDIYLEYNGVNYVNIPDTEQNRLDAHITQLLTDINVGSDASSSSQVKKYHVDYTIDVDNEPQSAVTVENKADYYYGETAHIDLTKYMSDQYTVKCTVTSESGGKQPTTYNLADTDYIVSILIQEDITVDVEITENEAITVKDYYGTVIGIGYIPEGGATVNVMGDQITINNGDPIKVKEYPKFDFVRWSLEDGIHTIDKATEIKQIGVLNEGADKTISAVNGTVNGSDSINTPYFNIKLSLEAAEGSIWTRTVGEKEYLASYDSSFVAFTSNEDVVFTAYDPSNLPDSVSSQVSDSIPAIYGTGYFTNDRFTLSCDYSAPDNVKVVEAGIICSLTDDASTADTLVKGGANTFTASANRISHWNDSDNSGTFTITLNNSDTGTYYMRAYVSYTKEYVAGDSSGATVPYVTYCERIFKCEDGVVTPVN